MVNGGSAVAWAGRVSREASDRDLSALVVDVVLLGRLARLRLVDLVLRLRRRVGDGRQRVRRSEQERGVDALAEPAQAEVQVRSGRATGRTDLAERLAALDDVALLHRDRRE